MKSKFKLYPLSKGVYDRDSHFGEAHWFCTRGIYYWTEWAIFKMLEIDIFSLN